MAQFIAPTEGITALTAAELAEKIHSRELTSREVTQAFLDRIAETDGELNAFLLPTPSISPSTLAKSPPPLWPVCRWRSRICW